MFGRKAREEDVGVGVEGLEVDIKVSWRGVCGRDGGCDDGFEVGFAVEEAGWMSV